MFFTTEDVRGPRRATEFWLDYEAAEAVGQTRSVEIEQQTDRYAAHPQVSEQLRFVWRQERCDRLDFNYDLTIDDKVGMKTLIEDHPLVGDRDCDLPFIRQEHLSQLEAKALLIYGFEQSPPCVTMNLDRKANDLFGKSLLELHAQTPVALRGPRPSSVVNPSET